MAKQIDKILIDRNQIRQIVVELGRQITKDYEGKELFIVCVLRGAFIFTADLIREIKLNVNVDFMSVSSYGEDTSSSGVVRILRDLDSDITGKHVLIIEDIVDTGLTLKNLRDLLLTRNPASLKICAAFDKPERRVVQVKADYVGIKIPDEFVVGYGLDYAGQYRHLPDVCVLGDDGRDDS
jgi:hypoxanthine phosphoribosyltransferase